MILHLLKLVWHRKRANALVMAEIFFSFLIVFAVVTLGVSLFSRWTAPLGYSWRDVWVMDVRAGLPRKHSGTRTTPGDTAVEKTESEKTTARVERLLHELRSFPQIEALGADAMMPYSNRGWSTVLTINGERVEVNADEANDGFARAMQIKPIRGRWFLPDDEAQSYVPIVIDSNAARAMFGDKDPVGQKFPDQHFGDGGTREVRVVGVIPSFRHDGEFSSTNTKMVFFRSSLLHPWDPAPSQIAIRLRPGTPASFEAELNRRLHAEAADVTFRISHMEDMRRSSIRMRLAPVIALGVVALFLISMVALGLTGVLWQTVTRRMREIGLRRALGASGADVRMQVLAEVGLLATIAVGVGIVIVLQLPLLGLSRLVSPAEFATGFVSALFVIYAITFLCGAYPSWLASTIDPAEALRYE